MGSGRFSGESQMYTLINNYTDFAVIGLIILGLVKLLMVNVSVNLGWKGGTIFPMIYAAVSVGYACTLLINATGSFDEFEAVFAVAITAASMLGFLMRKPITVIAILLLCFPLSFLPAIIISALVSSFIANFIVGKLNKEQND